MINNLSQDRITSIENLIPKNITTRCGKNINPKENKWKYRDGSSDIDLNFNKIENIKFELINELKYVLSWYAEYRSGKHLQNIFTMFLTFSKTIYSRDHFCDQITATDILNYYGLLEKNNKYYLGVLSGMFKKWHSFGLLGISDDVIPLLETLRITGNQKGNHVRTMDPEKGPFTDNELIAIQRSLIDSFATNIVTLEEYLLTWLFILFGARSSQICMLKICDFVVDYDSKNHATYVLNVPRSKQRNKNSREEFKSRLIISDIGILINSHIKKIKESYKDDIDDISKIALFPTKKIKNAKEELYHLTTTLISTKIKSIFKRLNIISERTGSKIKITPYRFRYTLGTRAAQEGHGELVIVELLDHTDTQNVGVYVECTPEIIQRIDKALALHIAPLAQAFAGLIIEDESKARRGNDPSSRIVAPQIDPSFKPIGNCGKHGFCNFLTPIACYTCKNFEPWLDAPHEAVLDYMLAEKERLLNTTDARIASTHDRTIFAIADVVERCKKIKEAQNG
ncbi:MAG: site-specific integrase [Candidatus Paceibacterota bacterium]